MDMPANNLPVPAGGAPSPVGAGAPPEAGGEKVSPEQVQSALLQFLGRAKEIAESAGLDFMSLVSMVAGGAPSPAPMPVGGAPMGGEPLAPSGGPPM